MTSFEGWSLAAGITSGLGAVGALIISMVAMSRRQNVKVQQPLEIKQASDFVHKGEFDRMTEQNEQTHRDIFAKLGGIERGATGNLDKLKGEIHAMELRINESGETRSEKIHTRINEVLAEVSEIRGELKNIGS